MMTSYFMTGEHRPYKSATGVFGRPIPKHNLGRGGSGAWEVAFRVSHVDLHDAAAINGPSAGGKELNLTFGVNWYPNPNTRVTLNYVTGWVDDRVVTGVPLDNSTFGVVMMRFQVDL
jgi:phosphate-selective porin OprO/OprP